MTLPGRSEPSAEDAMLYSALSRWHTWRESFLDRRVGQDEARRLAAAAAHLPLTRWVVSLFDVGHRVGRRDSALIQQASLVGVLSTRNDEPRDWLVAVQALQRVLLTAAVAGLLVGFANQPCQVGWPLRGEVATALGWSGYPQLVLRAGYPSWLPRPAPRRSISDVLLPTSSPAMTSTGPARADIATKVTEHRGF